MLGIERLKFILEILHKNKVVLVSDLSKEMNVSEETIRRDLDKLESQDHICRVHGGAYLKEGYGNETPVTVREKLYLKEKESIAAKCMYYIKEQDSIFLDCSTTGQYIAKELVKTKKKVTVITNSLNIVNELSASIHIRAILVGGELNKDINAFFGHSTIDGLENYFTDKAFISSAGISIKSGITDYTYEEAIVRKKMIHQSRECYYVADVTKIGRSAVNVIGILDEIDYLITSQSIENSNPDLLSALTHRSVKVVSCL